jgi:gamma-glutamyltranspeptidase
VPTTLTVPGAVASWTEAHAAYGRVPLKRLLEAAIDYADNGLPVTARLASFLAMMRGELAEHRETAAIFLLDGSVPNAGRRLVNRSLARTLEAVAEGGWAGFYEGPVAREMTRCAGR